MKKLLVLSLLALICVTSAANSNNCCKGPLNVVSKGKCIDGLNVTGITCPRKYLISSEEDSGGFSVNENGELVIEGTAPISANKFCLTKEKNQEPVVAIVCFPEEMQQAQSETLVRAVCSIISVLFLVATFLVYLIVPTLRDLQGRCLMHLVGALAMSMFLLAILQIYSIMSQIACYVAGYATFIAFLVTFAWLNVVSFNIWQATVTPASLVTPKQWEIIYLAYGYGIPLILLIAAIMGHHIEGNHIKPEIGIDSCWFSNRKSIWAYFYGPVAVMICINVILYIFAIKRLWDSNGNTEQATKIKSLRYKCLMFIKLFFIMGITWIFEIVSFAFTNQNNFLDYVWAVTDFINGLQGVLIFLVLVVFRKKALIGLARKKLCCVTLPPQWKTLHDEECDEILEEEKINDESSPPSEKIAKEVPSPV